MALKKNLDCLAKTVKRGFFYCRKIQFMKAIRSVCAVLLLSLFSLLSFAQNKPGIILRSAPAGTAQNTLDPNNDNHVSATTAGFGGSDDVTTSEVAYKPIAPYNIEPNSDLRRGPNHQFSDFVPGVDNSSYYMYYRNTVGSEALLFRMRLGSVMPGAKGYSVLFDTDGKFGATGPNADPNYVAAATGIGGNPGFEIEIVLATGGGADGILVYNVDGTDNPTLITSLPGWTNYSQIAIAATNDNGDPDFYIDYYVPKAALDAAGLTTATSFRVIPTTVMAPKAATGGPKSDIYGLADNNYKDPMAQYEAFINAQPSFKLTDLSGSGTTSPTGSLCTAAPTVSSPVNVGASVTVSGSWVKSSLTGAAGSATIYLYKNGGGVPVAQTAAPVASGAGWSISGVAVSGGDVFTAKAQANGESVCLVSNGVTAQSCNSGNTPSTTGLAITCNSTRGLEGTFSSGNGVTVYFINPATLATSTLGGPAAASPTFGYSGTNWYYNGTAYNGSQIASACSGGSQDMNNGAYYVTTNTAGSGCESAPVFGCIGLGSTTATPVITQNVLYNTVTQVSGTASSGALVTLWINGQQKATATAAGGAYGFSGLLLAVGDVIEVRAVAANSCVSAVASRTVVCFTATPTVTTDNTGQLTAGAAISGVSGEASGTSIRIYNGSGIVMSTAAVQADGTWSTANAGTANSNGFTGLAAAGTSYYAIAQNGTCGLSTGTAAFSTPSGATSSARCGALTATVPSSSPLTLAVSTTGLSGTLSGTTAANTAVNIYQDGILIGSTTTNNNAWGATPVDVTNKLYNGGVVMLGVQEASKSEYVCPATYTVACTAPLTPSVAFISCTNCGSTQNPSNIANGGMITYRLTNLQGNTYYSLREQLSGKALAGGTWTAATPPASLDITTYPLTTGGNFTAEAVGTFVSSSGMCSAKATQSYQVILPLRLLAFKGRRANNANELTWRTAAEVDFRRFEIERSTDGNRFETIGQTTARGGGDYFFADSRVTSAVNYYRLKLVNKNGSFAYSSVVLLKGTNSLSISLATPNPFNGEVNVQVTTAKSGNVTLSLLDEKGRQVARKQTMAAAGANTVRLSNLQHLAAGMYLLQIATETETLQQKLLKVR